MTWMVTPLFLLHLCLRHLLLCLVTQMQQMMMKTVHQYTRKPRQWGMQTGAKRCKSDLMADIQTIFTHDVKAINPDPGKEEAGHWCKVCKAKGVTQKHKDHIKVYKECCHKHQIQPHICALPSDSHSNQSTLDSAII
ncbi:hypothetical protein BDR04DRAFT_1120348 [Suillus decipiens]|nr:hypothetical protein BDR04DRAFT_1120348 [Suillus decipiens]